MPELYNLKKGRIPNSGIYLILDKKLSGERDPLALAQEAVDGGVDIIQLRDKESTVRKIIDEADKLRELAQRKNITFIINDRTDVALAVGAHGVHLGEGDLPLSLARQILGRDRIVGVSVHSLAQAEQAEKMGADYISVGAIFPTKTKLGARVVGIELFKETVAKIRVPLVAIGGINLNNIGEVIKAGAKIIAVGEAILGREDVAEAARELKLKIPDTRYQLSDI